MFSVGFWELCLVFLIALIVINPKKYPSLLYNIGVTIRKCRQFCEQIFN